MTEIMKKIVIMVTPSHPAPSTLRYALDPVAFAFALICAPLLVALLGFWVLGIPVFALFFGVPPYLVFGTPILLFYLRLRRGTPLGAAKLAFGTVAAGLVAIVSGLALQGDTFDVDAMMFFGGCALVFGPLWGMTFGYLYNRWRNDLSRHPVPLFA